MAKRSFYQLVWRELHWQRPYTQEQVCNILSHLASTIPRGAIIWEARGHGGYVKHIIGADAAYIRRIESVMKAHGDIRFYPLEDYHRAPVSAARQLVISHTGLSLSTDTISSTIRAGLAALAAVRGEDESVMQIVLGKSFRPQPTPKHIPDPHVSWLKAIIFGVDEASVETKKSIREKNEQHCFEVHIRIGVSGDRAQSRINTILNALRTLESVGTRMHTLPDKPQHLISAKVPWHFPLRLSVKELTSFMLLPFGEDELPGTSGLHPKLTLPPAWYREPTNRLYDRSFAKSMVPSGSQRLSISPQANLQHSILIGPTGCGKSTVLEHLILADIRAGRSTLVIDPKADLVNRILERIPEIFSENWGIRSQDVLSAALLTLMHTKGASLLWLPALLTNESFRHRITDKLQDEVVLKPFWKSYDAMRDTERKQEIAPVLNKMRQFLYRPGLRSVLGQSEPRFHLTDLFYHRRVVLVPLNKGTIGSESAKLLGSLIVGLTWTLALSRAKLPPERRHIVSVYIDELQDYLRLPTDLSDALAQARGLGVGITMAHQYRAQLSPELRAGIDANARNKIVFGLNSSDAKEMASMAPELTALDFMNLPRYEVYTSFMSDGKATGWIRGTTFPPEPAIRSSVELRARCQSRYGVPAETVDRDFIQLLKESEEEIQPDLNDTALGRRKISRAILTGSSLECSQTEVLPARTRKTERALIG